MNTDTNESDWTELEGDDVTDDTIANGIDAAGQAKPFREWVEGIGEDMHMADAAVYPAFTYVTPDNDIVQLFLDWPMFYTPAQTSWPTGSLTLIPISSPEDLQDILKTLLEG